MGEFHVPGILFISDLVDQVCLRTLFCCSLVNLFLANVVGFFFIIEDLFFGLTLSEALYKH